MTKKDFSRLGVANNNNDFLIRLDYPKKILVGWVSQNNNDFLVRLDSPNGNISVSRHCNGLNKSFKNTHQFKTNKPQQLLGERHYNIPAQNYLLSGCAGFFVYLSITQLFKPEIIFY